MQPSECEPGLAGAGVPRHRGGRRKREPARKEEAEMGQVRESRESEERAGGRAGRASYRGLTSKAAKDTGRGRSKERGGGARGKGHLKEGPAPCCSHYTDGQAEVKEAKVSA